MTAEELIGEMPKAILMWYPFEDGKKKIVIDDSNIKKVEELEEGFDYIIVTQSVEKESSPEKILSMLRKKLNFDGKLFLMMNNRLGIRYFCGDKDPYTGNVMECLENYLNADLSNATGRMYDKTQMKKLLKEAGFSSVQFFSVFSGLHHPSILFSEDYVPNEDLTNRIFPSYHFPKTVFLEEKVMYKQLVDNNLFHQMSNAYLVECSLNGRLTDVAQVTSSLDRGKEDALFTIIYKSGLVEKKAAYEEGKLRLWEIEKNCKILKENGILVVEGALENDIYKMEFVQEEMTQLYFRRLLREDINLFLSEMDHFKDTILKSSTIIEPDKGDGYGAILKYGFPDLVSLNSFHVNDDFLFFDQEFRMEKCPANFLFWRLLTSFYSADLEAEQIYPKEKMIERFDLKRQQNKWQTMEWDFLKSLRNEYVLNEYHIKTRTNKVNILANRTRMNESAVDFEMKYYNIFANMEKRRLILFGTGTYAKKFLELYGKDFPIYAMLDNREDRTDHNINGIVIKSPDFLKSMSSNSYKVIICIKDYQEVARQLDDMGISNYSIYDPTKYYQTIPRTSIQILNVDDENRNAKTDNAIDNATDGKYEVGYVAGAFDMFHIGHLNLIRRAKERCHYLIVGVMSDERMFQLKNKYPIIPCHERMNIVAACRYVDQVEELPLDRASIKDAYHMFHFDCMFSGDDHSEHPSWLAEKAYLQEQGSDIVFFPYTKETSSSEIRGKIDLK